MITQVQAFVLLAAILCWSDGAAAARKKRDLPSIWENIKTLPKNEIASSVKSIFNPNAKNELDESVTTEIKGYLKSPHVDPLIIHHADIKFEHDPIKMNGSLDMVNITGLSKIKVIKIHVNVLLLKADFEFALPSLAVSGNYNIDCLVDGVLPVFGNGPFQVNVTKAKAKGTVKVGIKDGSVYIKSLDLDLTLGGIKVDIQNLMEDEDISKVANQMINEMAPGMFADNKEAIEKTVANRLMEFFNSKMAGVSLRTIMDAITGEGRKKAETVEKVLAPE